jgi:hypothetical protein
MGKDRKESCKSLQGHEHIPCRYPSVWECLRNPEPCSLGKPEEGLTMELELEMVKAKGWVMG